MDGTLFSFFSKPSGQSGPSQGQWQGARMKELSARKGPGGRRITTAPEGVVLVCFNTPSAEEALASSSDRVGTLLKRKGAFIVEDGDEPCKRLQTTEPLAGTISGGTFLEHLERAVMEGGNEPYMFFLWRWR